MTQKQLNHQSQLCHQYKRTSLQRASQLRTTLAHRRQLEQDRERLQCQFEEQRARVERARMHVAEAVKRVRARVRVVCASVQSVRVCHTHGCWKCAGLLLSLTLSLPSFTVPRGKGRPGESNTACG